MRSTPESITATRTGASGGGVSQASYERLAAAYHWRGASGSVGAKASRRPRSRSTQATPGTPSRAAPVGMSTASARNGARLVGRWPVARSTAVATTAASAPGARPT